MKYLISPFPSYLSDGGRIPHPTGLAEQTVGFKCDAAEERLLVKEDLGDAIYHSAHLFSFLDLFVKELQNNQQRM